MKTVLSPPSLDGQETTTPPTSWVWPLVHGGVALAVSGLACLLARRSFPDDLRIRTDVIGYPIWANFNVFDYFRNFYLLVLGFPLGVLLVYHLLGLLGRRRRPPVVRPRQLAPSSWIDLDEPDRHQPLRYTAGRILFNCSVLGLALGFVTEPPRDFWLTVASAAMGFAALTAGAAAVLRLLLPGISYRGRLSAANALAVPVGMLLLAGISSNTRMTVLSDGTVDRIPWMPWWLAAVIAVALTTVIWRALRTASDPDMRRIERRAVLLVAAPVGLFLVFAALARPLGHLDVFHDGESLSAARLVADGAFPWRDVFFIHGLMEDVFRPGLGLWAVQDSAWGYSAGHTLLFTPLYWLAHYALAVRLFGRSWLFLVLTTALAFNGYVTPQHHRFILQPLVLVLLIALLSKPSRPRAAAFVLLALTHAIVTPEASYLLPAAAAVLVAFETYYRTPGERLVERYRRTLACAAFAAAFVAAWCLFLSLNGALSSFIFYYRTFAPDHALTGGIPVLSNDLPFFDFAAVAPGVLAVLTFVYLTVRIRMRRPLGVEDWAMMAIAMYTVAYYQKFLSRADAHAYQALAVSLPLLYYAVYKAVGAVEGLLGRRPTGNRLLAATTQTPITLGLVVFVLVNWAEPQVDDRMRWMPDNFHAQVLEPPKMERLGYTGADIIDQGLLADVEVVLDATLRPGDHLFDMTNNPGLYYFLLDAEPIRRYFHVSMAIRSDTQRDLLRQMRRDRPKVVVLGGSTGLPNWDGIPATVRHYAVSEYVLRNYRPLLTVRGMLFLLRQDAPIPPVGMLAGLSEPPAMENLLLDQVSCNWGYAPNFFSDPGGPAARARGVNVPFRSSERGGVREVLLELPPEAARKGFSRLEIQTTTGFAEDSFVLSADPADDARAIQFKTLKRDRNRYRVRVGSCPQWYEFPGTTLSLRHQAPQQIVAIKLYR